jgi:DNA repair protein SbcD/Mre11
MRLLHTADWHLGKLLKGRERTGEIDKALGELLALVRSEKIDAVLVAGDLFDRTIVSAEADAAAFGFFLALAELGVPALVIAGNHDSRERLESIAPLLRLAGATVFGNVRFAEQGGVVDLAEAKVALWKGIYGEGMRRIIKNLEQGFAETNILVSHLTVEGGRLGGGEFSFHTTNTYALKTQDFPQTLSYVALGHLHRQQQVAESPVAWYSGSLVQLDFGEGEANSRGALVVEILPGQSPRIYPVPGWGRPLRTFRLDKDALDSRWQEIKNFAGYSKIVLEGGGNPALRERLFKEMPDLLEVEFAEANTAPETPEISVENLDWSQAYTQYRAQQGLPASPELLKAFGTVLEEVQKEGTV